MPRATLLDFFEDFSRLKGTFIVHDDGYRVRKVSYGELSRMAYAFADRLDRQQIREGEKVVFWSENRPEWIAAFWGCLIAQVIVVPVDYRASEDLLRRVASIVKAKAILIGDALKLSADSTLAPVWSMHDAVPLEAAAGDHAVGGGLQPAAHHDRRGPGDASQLAEIIFTSGATAEPKGVTITHRNVLANLVPIEREIQKYRKYAFPFHPIKFLNLLPLSHMFGQSMAAFIPPLLRGTVIFTHSYSPVEIVHQIKSRRISVLVCVPKVLDVLREHILRVAPDAAAAADESALHWTKRWWRHRSIHRLFGYKFWCFVSGAAPLDPELETFWRRLGFVVVQGYGLTETAPIVTLNHPFRASKGTVGKPIAGVEVRIAPDGEVLVRGENVTSGYYRGDAASDAGGDIAAAAFDDGWFHTGDIGEVDSAGRLLIKGRKKEMIVTAQGLNVFPEDVERALMAQRGVKEAGVIGLAVAGEERVHAVLITEPGADVDAIVRGANQSLEDHQRVWSTSIWPGETLPRTEGTQKLKRRELQRWAAAGAPAEAPAAVQAVTFEDVVSRYVAGRDLRDGTTLDELGLSSLDRVELIMALEDAFHTTLEESAVAEAKTLGDLKQLIALGQVGSPEDAELKFRATAARAATAVRATAPDATMPFPSYNRWRASWWLRRVSLPTWILPLARPFMQRQVHGLEHLKDLPGPVVFAANHESHMDGPAIFLSLPARWRYHLAPAMAREFFYAHFHRREVGFKSWFTNSLNYLGATLGFNAFPLPQSGAGTRQTLRYIGEVVADGYSILIFPEGTRAAPGQIAMFRPGVAMIAARLDLPVIPVRLRGTGNVLDPHWRWPKRGLVSVSFGAPMRFTGDDYIAMAKQIENAVRNLA